mgnify:CR=1 FL=1
MTTIIGVQGEEGCLLAADSRTTGETGRPYRHEFVEKITERGFYMIACSGDADACDIIQHQWDPPKPPKNVKKHYKFMDFLVILMVYHQNLFLLYHQIYYLD